ncbi:hypothetical protein TRVA0_005S03664 [Trichomonascus vanleenenianus]|uniref:uncharacterized protein n=1 Tax=Trichomonascus vanleenenianus TaxID=2268995 RepID=UPI003EC989A4
MSDDGDVSMAESARARNRLVGDHRILAESPIVLDILLYRKQSGESAIVWVRKNSLSTKQDVYRVSGEIRKACIVPYSTRDTIVALVESLERRNQFRIVNFDLDADGTVIPGNISGVNFEIAEHLGLGEKSLQSDSQGSAFALTMMNKVMFFCSKDSENGLDGSAFSGGVDNQLIIIDGATVIQGCFLAPMRNAPSLVFYVVLYISADGRFKLALYEWYKGQPASTMRSCGVLPLKIEPPLFMTPVANDSASIVLCSEQVMYVTNPHDILSGSYRIEEFYFGKEEFAPNGYYVPRIADIEEYLEGPPSQGSFYIISRPSSVYEIKATQDKLIVGTEIDLEVAIGNHITVEPMSGKGRRLLITFGGDTSFGGQRSVSRINDKWDLDDNISSALDVEPVFEDYNNWAPINDMAVITARNLKGSSLFACTGLNQTGALTQFSYGHEASIVGGKLPLQDAPLEIKLIALASDKEFFLAFIYPSITVIYSVSTRPYFLLQELDDDCGLIFDQRTLAIDRVGELDGVIQVVPHQILLTDMNGRAVHEPFAFPCTHASIHNDLIVAIFEDTNGLEPLKSVVKLYRFNKGLQTFRNTATVEINEVCTFARIVNQPSGLRLYVGTRTPSLIVYSVDDDTSSPGFGNYEELTNIFQSADAIPDNLGLDGSECFIGLRDGNVICCQMEPSLHAVKTLELGSSSVEFAETAAGRIIALSNGIASVINSKELSSRQIVIPAIYNHNISVVGKFNLPNEVGYLGVIAMVNDDFYILKVRVTESAVVNQLLLGSTPRRLASFPSLSTVVVALSSKYAVEGSFEGLACIDLHTFTTCQSQRRLTFTKKGVLTATPVVEEDEKVRSLLNWQIEMDESSYVFLALGLETRNGRGIVRIVRIERPKRNIVVKKLASWPTPGPVHALCKLGRNGIIYSVNDRADHRVGRVGYKCIGMEEGGGYGFSDEVLSENLGSAVIKLKVRGELVLAATQSKSLSTIRFDDSIFTGRQSDGRERLLIDEEVGEQEQVVLLSDKASDLTVLSAYSHRSSTLPFQFSIPMPALMSVIRKDPVGDIWWDRATSTLDQEHFIAGGLDGSLHGISVYNTNEIQEDGKNYKRLPYGEESGQNTP